MRQLDNSQVSLIGQASNLGIIDSLSNLKHSCFGNGFWLKFNNRYCRNTINILKNDIRNSQINDTELIEYIAASAPLHCTDGWSYLGRALQSHVRSDYDSARHLAYYAELRATMSFLATQGIGIFNRDHFIVDAQSKCHLIRGFGTHEISWLALQEWSQRSGDLLADIISVKNRSLRDWLVALGQGGLSPSGNVMPITQDWLKKWGVDLSVMNSDRDERNNASYRPNRLTRSASINVLRSSCFVRELWTLFRPSGLSIFEDLDKHLLRLSLELLYQSSGRDLEKNSGAYEKRIRSTIEALNITNDSPEEERLTHFLTRRNSPYDPQIISEASVPIPPLTDEINLDKPYHHLQVISRAALLLRVSSASCSRLLRDSLINPCDDLGFWWRNLGEERGLWQDSNTSEESLEDLWEDIEFAMQNVQKWEQSNSVNPCYGNWQMNCSQSLFTLSGCELISLWGLGI